MKHCLIASTIEIKTQATKNTLCACKMRGEGSMPLNNVNVGKEFLPIHKCAFRQQAFLNVRSSWKFHSDLFFVMQMSQGTWMVAILFLLINALTDVHNYWLKSSGLYQSWMVFQNMSNCSPQSGPLGIDRTIFLRGLLQWYFFPQIV